MKAEIITVGTELLMGTVLDTNSSYIARKLESLGIGTYFKQTVGDNPQRIQASLKTALDRSQLIIIAGGLGPTRDDITKEAVAAALGIDLMLDQAHLKEIETYFQERGRSMTTLDQKQAQILAHSKIFNNDNGLALGCANKFPYLDRFSYIIILPGPPRELELMVDRYLLTYLKDEFNQQPVIQSKYIEIKPMGEAYLADKLDELIQNQTNPTIAIYAKPNKLQLRLTATADSQQTAEKLLADLSDEIETRLGADQLLKEDETLEEMIIHKMTEEGTTLGLAESLTGGLVSSSLTTVPGAGEVLVGGFVTYQTSSKYKYLGIDLDFIDHYSVVSAEVAQAMAVNCQKKSQSDYGLSLTGVAGPDSLDGHPVGQVFIGLAQPDQQVLIKELNLGRQSRDKIRLLAKEEALKLLASVFK